MDIIRKDATIQNTTEDFPGSFEVILSAPTKDRDGDTLLPDEWKQPLPEHITFDSDHGMTVATTVGSGVPRIDQETGNLIVSGTYSSLPRAQEVRTLVNEGHIRTTSVAFMSEKTEKDGKTVAQRELLNGAFVAIPSNREALVLASKGVKAGARNSAADLTAIQEIHDLAESLGADCSGAKSAKVEISLDDLVNAAENGTITAKDVFDAFGLEYPEADTKSLADADPAPDESEDVTPDASTPDEDESAEPATASAAAPAKAAAPAETKAADDDELQMRVRAIDLIASTYAD